VRLAARLRKETTMRLKWIAQHLEMGSWTHISNLLGTRKHESFKSENYTCTVFCILTASGTAGAIAPAVWSAVGSMSNPRSGFRD
jgi:hypothetical protein